MPRSSSLAVRLVRLPAVLLLPFLLLTQACTCPTEEAAPSAEELQSEVQSFLDTYTAEFLTLFTAAAEAEWAANTRIVEGDDTNRQRVEAANEAVAQFTGKVETIETTRGYLERRADLTDLQVRQLEAVLYRAANNPGTVPELVKERIAAEALQTERLYGYQFTLDGRPVSANDLDDVLENSKNLDEKRRAWEASKAVGPTLREGLTRLVELRNGTVQALGYDDYFEYQVSDYGMTGDEMMTLLEGFIRDLWPLYRELHTWTRYELAARYGTEVPEMLPAHWLPNRWAQSWAPIVKIEGLDLDAVLADREPEWLVQQAEDFYKSLGYPALPAVFWEKSSLYPVPEGADYQKNSHASAWHMDLREDVRSLMSVQPNQRWWETTHHELGHIYYYIAYTRPEVPPLLRAGANRAFHEGIGTLLGLASLQPPFLEGRGLLAEGSEIDEIQTLLKEALDTVVFIPFSAGTMSHFERDLYAGTVTPANYNERWWQYVKQYQGVEPPEARGEEFCDPTTKTHVNDDPAQYYDYALSYMILYQLHDHIATSILQENPRRTNYYGNQEIGKFLGGILELGATRDWREVMREKVGQEISGKAMLNYYAPLLEFLRKENEGRVHTLAAEI